jgi:hypothetical protein
MAVIFWVLVVGFGFLPSVVSAQDDPDPAPRKRPPPTTSDPVEGKVLRSPPPRRAPDVEGPVAPDPAPEAPVEPPPPKPKANAEPLTAEKAQELFDSIFAVQVAGAKTTGPKDDDVKLAEQLIASAKTSFEHPQLVILLARTAYDLTVKVPAGYKIALEATQLLLRFDPEQKRQTSDMALALLKKQFSSAKRAEREEIGVLYIQQLMGAADLDREAEDINAALRRYTEAIHVATRIRYEDKDQITEAQKTSLSQKKVFDQITLYKGRLKRDKDDKDAVTKLVMLYVIELNEPHQARKYTFLLSDKSIGKNVSLASGSPGKLESADAYGLAQWYNTLGSKNPTKLHLLERSITAYERYLSLAIPEGNSIKKTAATFALKELRNRYEKLTEPKVTTLVRGKAINALSLVHLKKHVVGGEWVKSGSRIGTQNKALNSLVRIPIQPNGDYQVQVTFERKLYSNGQVAVMLPIKDKMVTFVMGDSYYSSSSSYYSDSYTYGGLSRVNGYRVTTSSNPTRTGGAIWNGRRMTFVISVMMRGENAARVFISYRGKKYVDWTGPLSNLTPDARWNLTGPPSIALGTDKAIVAFHAVKFKLVKGTAKVLKSRDLTDSGGGS